MRGWQQLQNKLLGAQGCECRRYESERYKGYRNERYKGYRSEVHKGCEAERYKGYRAERHRGCGAEGRRGCDAYKGNRAEMLVGVQEVGCCSGSKVHTVEQYPALEGRGPFPSDLSRQKWTDQPRMCCQPGQHAAHLHSRLAVQVLSSRICALCQALLVYVKYRWFV